METLPLSPRDGLPSTSGGGNSLPLVGDHLLFGNISLFIDHSLLLVNE